MERTQLIRVYTNRLVRALVPSEFGPEFIQSVSHDLVQTLLSPNQQSHFDINQLIDNYRSHFIDSGHHEKWTAFQNILESLSKVKSLEQIERYLVFLSLLQSDPSKPQQPSQRLSSLHPESIFSPTSDAFGASPPPNRPYARSIGAGSGSVSGIQSSTPAPKIPIEYPQSSPYKDSSSTMEQAIQPYYESMPEDVVLTYLSYTLLGLDSKLLRFDTDKQAEIPSSLNNSYSGMLFDILECALLYKNLHNFIQTYKGKLNSPIKTAFSTVLESQLDAYVNHINRLFSTQSSSLIAVYHSIYEWILKLRLLYTLQHDIVESNGYDFLSKVYRLTKFGDVIIKQLSQNIFNTISSPYYEILEHWIINGELIDESNDFFIRFEFENNDFNDIIKFLPSRIPFFFDEKVSYRILQIGKMLIFLAKYCKELVWINQYSTKYSYIIFELNRGLKSLSPSKVKELINLQYEELLNYFTIVIQGPKNELYQHLKNFKKIYFIQNNDFIDSIITNGVELFNEPSTNISSNYLSKILTDSINYSSLKCNKYSTRLDARVLDPIHGNIGWEVFTLEYRIDDLPIITLLENKMAQYLKMFNFLWRLRHLQYLLNEHSIDCYSLRKNELRSVHLKYLKIQKESRSLRDKKVLWLMKSFNTINMIRLNLTKFLNALVSYLSFDVIEDSFDKLAKKKLFRSSKFHENKTTNIDSSNQLLNALNPGFVQSFKGTTFDFGQYGEQNKVAHNMNELTFDEIIQIHQTYLDRIVNNKLISDDSFGKSSKKTYIQQIYEILEVIFKFYKSAEEYNNLIITYTLSLNLETNQNDDMEMMDLDSIQDTETNLQAITTRIYKQIYAQFQLQLLELVKDLKMDHELRPFVHAFT